MRLRQVFEQKAEQLIRQYGAMLSFYRQHFPDMYFDILNVGNEKINDLSSNSMYARFHANFKDLDFDEVVNL